MTRRAKSRGFKGVLAALALSAAILPQASASADGFNTGPPNGGRKADNGTHSWCYLSWDTDMVTGANAAMTMLKNTTDMSNSYKSSCDSQTDAQFDLVNLTGSTRGSYVCEWWTGSKCNRSRIKIDKWEINVGSNDEEDLEKTACHEVGHSVGLTHGGSTDCMLSGEVPSTSSTYRTFNSHHESHIDNNY